MAARLRDLAAYLDRTPEPEWRWVRVEFEAMAKTLYRHAPAETPSAGDGEAHDEADGAVPQV